jgi:hypothetical protein
VGSVDNHEIGVDLGSFVEKGGRTTVTEKDADRIEKDRKRKKAPDQYRITVKLVREGESVFPVDMKMTLENGEIVRERWDGRDRWVKYEYTRDSKARSVEIDPERKILLDGSLADNSWVAKPDLLPFAKWGSNLVFWIQMVLP